jgi:hypothetical protein
MSGLGITNPSYEIGNASAVWLRLCRAVFSRDEVRDLPVELRTQVVKAAMRL